MRRKLRHLVAVRDKATGEVRILGKLDESGKTITFVDYDKIVYGVENEPVTMAISKEKTSCMEKLYALKASMA